MFKNRKIILKILIIGIISISSILIGFIWFLNPLIPTRWNADPYSLNIYELYTGANVVENEQIVVNDNVANYIYNESSDILLITLNDSFHNIQIVFQFNNWSKHEKFNNTIVKVGNSYSFKGISLLISEGIIVGLDIVEIHSIRTYILSLIGLIIIIPLIFYYFKIDFRKLKLIRRREMKGNRGS